MGGRTTGGRGRPPGRRRAASVAGALLLAAATLLVPAGPVVAAGRGGSADDVTTLDAKARAASADAARAAAEVDRLTAEYVTRSRTARAAADRLAAAFAVSADADRLRDADAADLRASRAAHTARIRALYAEGDGLLAAAVLAADGSEDALWRLSTMDVIRADLLQQSSARVDVASTRARRSAALAAAAADADTRLASALREVQDEAVAAAEALTRARSALQRLDRTAQDAAAARDAARRLAEAEAKAQADRLAAAQATGALGIPVGFERLYRDAATSCPGMDWTLLAAVGQVESGHGRNNGPSSAGAIGPMQFMPATFDAYAVDGDHDGDTDAWDPADAIWTAARYLCASGAEGGTDEGVQRALFAYNHAQWYVDLVLGARQAIRDGAAAEQSG